MKEARVAVAPFVSDVPDSAFALQCHAGVARLGLLRSGDPASAASASPQRRAGAGQGRVRRGGPAKSAPSEDQGQNESEPIPAAVRIGVISDSHGYLDPAVLEIFAGVARIVHAGDIGDLQILAALQALAPVTAVSGNIEPEEILASLPREAGGEVGGVNFVVAHKRKRLFKRLAAGKMSSSPGAGLPTLVIYGHDHVPSAAWVEGTLFLNPGTAASPDDEDDDPTVAIVDVGGTGLAVTFVPLVRRIAQESAPDDDRGLPALRHVGLPGCLQFRSALWPDRGLIRAAPIPRKP